MGRGEIRDARRCELMKNLIWPAMIHSQVHSSLGNLAVSDAAVAVQSQFVTPLNYDLLV